MKRGSISPWGVGAALLMLSGLLAGSVQAQSSDLLFTLEGTTPQARYEGEGDIKLSLRERSGEEARSAVVEAFRQWREDGDDEAFASVLREQNTLGYLFTAEVTGYSVKYAFENSNEESTLLIVPNLKSKDPYMWKERPSKEAPPFTLLEIQWEEKGETGVVRHAAADKARLNEAGTAIIAEDASMQHFADVKDATPYYLETPSS